MFRRALPTDRHAAGLLHFLAINIYTPAVRDISLAYISYKVSDDSLSRLVTRIGCRVSLRTVGRPIGGGGWGTQRVLYNARVVY